MSKIIEQVCGLLNGLCRNIVELLIAFKQLNDIIGQLASEQRKVQESVEDADDDSEMQEASTPDEDTYLDFMQYMHRMRKLSVSISSMAGLYAEVIKEAISPGFNLAVGASYETHGQTTPAAILYCRQNSMEEFVLKAERVCLAIESKEAARRVTRLANMDRVYKAKIEDLFGRGPGGGGY